MIQPWIFPVQVQLNTPKPLAVFLKDLVTSLPVTDPQEGFPPSQPIVLIGNPYFCCPWTWELGLLPGFHISGMIILNLEEQRFLHQVTWLHCFERLDGMGKDAAAAAVSSPPLLVSTRFSLCCITKTALRWNTAPFPDFSLFKTALAVCWRLLPPSCNFQAADMQVSFPIGLD